MMLICTLLFFHWEADIKHQSCNLTKRHVNRFLYKIITYIYLLSTTSTDLGTCIYLSHWTRGQRQ